MSLWRSLTDPKVSDHLIHDEGEAIIDEVRRHPIAFVIPTLLTLLGLAIMVSTLWFPLDFALIPLCIGLAIILFAAYRALTAHMDRFVITNIRVFRVHGIFSQHAATMPMARILDISVHKPFLGRIFRYGHFVFESAAQDQGLRDIRFVGRPNERDLTIQRVIQRSGLRGQMRLNDDPAEDEDPRNDTADILDEEGDTAGIFGTDSEAVGDSEAVEDTEAAWNTEATGEGTNTAAEDGVGPGTDDAGSAVGHDPDHTTGGYEHEELVPAASSRLAIPIGAAPHANDDAADTGEWNTLEINAGPTGDEHSAEIRRRRSRLDPIAAAATAWDERWAEKSRMEAVTSLMRVHHLLVSELDDHLRPLGLTYARFEVLRLLHFSPVGALPLVELIDRLQVQTTSATSLVKTLEDNGMLERTYDPDADDEVYAEITGKGLDVLERGGQIIADHRFGLGTLSEKEAERLTNLLSWPRMAAGDF